MNDMKAFLKAKELDNKLIPPESIVKQQLSLNDLPSLSNSPQFDPHQTFQNKQAFSKKENAKRSSFENIVLDSLLQEIPFKRNSLLENIFFKIVKK